MPRSAIAIGLHGKCLNFMFEFRRNCPTIFQIGCTILRSHQHAWEIHFSKFTQTFGSVCVRAHKYIYTINDYIHTRINFSYLNRCVVISHPILVLVCISLIAGDVKHLFHMLTCHSYFSSTKCLFLLFTQSCQNTPFLKYYWTLIFFHQICCLQIFSFSL